jgi:signal transduction histidine kinase
MENNQKYALKKSGREMNRVSGVYANDPVNALLLQLHELKKANDGLAELLDQRTSELEEIVATTTRSISVIGHDIRGPVCTVLAALELIKLKLESNFPVGSEQYINAATDSAKRTLNLLDELLEWSVSRNNCTSFNPVKINLFEFLTDELVKVNDPARLKSITVALSVAPELDVSGDIGMVGSIFRNLIGNAIKFTGHGGKIKVNARAAGRLVEITVEDNGIGMSSELQKTILKKHGDFFEIPGRNSRVNGIGLLLTREFIESHGGTLRIASSPGKGSKFKFSLERIDRSGSNHQE